jgi:hypothetical protein
MPSLIYRGRDLLTDHQALAELYVRWWSLSKDLNKFIEKAIDDSKYVERIGHNVLLGKENPLQE